MTERKLTQLVARAKQIQAERRKRKEQPEDRRNFLLTLRNGLIQQQDKERGAL